MPPDGNASQQITHLAIIMDGNARWAQASGTSLIAAYERGAQNAWEIVIRCIQLQIRCATLYTFSIDNWKRDASSVVIPLMHLLASHINSTGPVMENDIRVIFIGELHKLSIDMQESIIAIQKLTEHNQTLLLVIAVSYGGQEEIMHAVRSISAKKLAPQEITHALFQKELYTKDLPPPDLLIRTGGEKRLSNFLLWQLAYTELYFCDTLWPDFSIEELGNAIADFQRRTRKYGL